MKFSYTALTRDNKKISGVLDVESDDAAHAELHKMGVAIISVNEISEEDYKKLKEEEEVVREKSGVKTLTFLAKDANGKEVEGTIDAKDEFAAYKRLRTEYQFDVINVYPSEASDAEKEALKSSMQPFEERLEFEIAEQKKKEGKEEEGETEKAKEMDQAVIAEVDRVVINTKKVLEEHQDLFTGELLREIETTLGELERIRTSNNVKHITEVSNDLYSLISNPDHIEEAEDISENYQSLMGEIKESALVKREFDLYKKAIEAAGVKKIFESITEKLKEITKPSTEEGEPKGFIGKIKSKIHKHLEEQSKKKREKVLKAKRAKKKKTRLSVFLDKLNSYTKATSPVLKKARKRELIYAFKSMFKKKMSEEEEKAEKIKAETKAKEEAVEKKEKRKAKKAVKKKVKGGRDFTHVFVEIDSFISWLLCFYIIYFFLVNFSLEKNIGLERDFVFKTLKTPLLLNITIFLLLLHFTLRLKTLHFRQNFLATIFLFFLSLGVYVLLIVNF